MKILVIGYLEGDIHEEEISGTLESMQEVVDGLIQCAATVELRQMGIELICDEEGLLKGLPTNLNLFPFFYVGQAFMVGVKGEEFASLTDEQMSFAREWLKCLEV